MNFFFALQQIYECKIGRELSQKNVDIDVDVDDMDVELSQPSILGASCTAGKI